MESKHKIGKRTTIRTTAGVTVATIKAPFKPYANLILLLLAINLVSLYLITKLFNITRENPVAEIWSQTSMKLVDPSFIDDPLFLSLVIYVDVTVAILFLACLHISMWQLAGREIITIGKDRLSIGNRFGCGLKKSTKLHEVEGIFMRGYFGRGGQLTSLRGGMGLTGGVLRARWGDMDYPFGIHLCADDAQALATALNAALPCRGSERSPGDPPPTAHSSTTHAQAMEIRPGKIIQRIGTRIKIQQQGDITIVTATTPKHAFRILLVLVFLLLTIPSVVELPRITEYISNGYLQILYNINLALGILLPAYILIWYLFGKEVIKIGNGQFTLGKNLHGSLGKKKAALDKVHNISAHGLLGTPAWIPMEIYRFALAGGVITIDMDGKTRRFGIALEHEHAQALADLLLEAVARRR